MQFRHVGALLMALQACGGVATAFALFPRDDPAPTNDTDPDAAGSTNKGMKIAKPNDGGDANTVIAYADGVCQTPLDKAAPNGGPPITSSFKVTKTFPDADEFPAQNWNPAKKGTGTPDNTPQGGWNVFFSLKQPEDGCRIIIMTDYPQQRPPDKGAPGIQLINAGSAGCYFASLMDGKGLKMSKCCKDECTPDATLGDASLGPNYIPHQKRATPAGLPARSQSGPAEPVSMVARAGLLARQDANKPDDPTTKSKFLTHAPPKTPNCTFTEKDKPYTQAGRQTIIQTFQNCQTSPCQFAAAKAQQYSSTIKMDHSDTITNGLSITAGITESFEPDGVGIELSQEIGYQMSKAIQNTYGTDETKGNTTTFTATSSVVTGQWVALTYTPTYTCYTGAFDCGDGANQAVNCVPNDLGGEVAANSGDLMPLVRG